MTSSSSSVDRLARRLNKVEEDVKAVATQPSLHRSAIDGGALTLRDQAGQDAGYVGEQFDGTNTVAAVGGTTPVSPTVPFVQPVIGGLRIYWDGTYVDDSLPRMDFSRVTFYAVPLADELDPLSPAQIVGEITTATGGEVTATLPYDDYLVYAVTWTHAGKYSYQSDPAFGTPAFVVGSDLDPGIDLGNGSDGDAPATDPVVTGTPGFNNIFLSWTTVPNDDPVAYDVAVGTVTGFDPNANIAFRPNSTTQNVPGVTPLFFKVRAVDADGPGPWSAQITATPKIGLDKPALDAILADEATPLEVNGKTFNGGTFNGNEFNGSVFNGSEINGGTFVGGLYKSQDAGERIEIATEDDSTIMFFNGNPNEVAPAEIRVVESGINSNNSGLEIRAGQPTVDTPIAWLGVSAYGDLPGTGGATDKNSVAYMAATGISLTSQGPPAPAPFTGFTTFDMSADTWSLKAPITTASVFPSILQAKRIQLNAPSALEGSAIDLLLKQIMPAGEIITTMSNAVAPVYRGLRMDGTTKLRATYPELFAALGTRYNTGGELSTEFRMPNAASRFLYGTSDPNLMLATSVGGSSSATITAAQIPFHTHAGNTAGQSNGHIHGGLAGGNFVQNNGNAGGANVTTGGGGYGLGPTNDVNQDHTHGFTTSTQSGSPGTAAFDKMPPYILVRHFMRY